ncbi:hypothetical protein Y717_20570 [Streptomyces scopuliridis RB72]|uniref:Uncharacterized protein n=1 Tax=Streptomyces scopuliridis RB72 TaxID=1440053 RepID=A0A2T7TDM8_9ACTN|nr:hypothetical protein Y717_20570 [Streptomyces scopuliridis RB72]
MWAVEASRCDDQSAGFDLAPGMSAALSRLASWFTGSEHEESGEEH